VSEVREMRHKSGFPRPYGTANLMGHNLLDKKSDRHVSRKRKRITSEEQIFVPKRKML